MLGAEGIRNIRRAGGKLPYIWVNDNNFVMDSSTASLQPGESPALQDWRFVVGATVIIDDINGFGEAIALACKPYAKRTIWSRVDEKFRVTQIVDSAGDLTWPK